MKSTKSYILFLKTKPGGFLQDTEFLVSPYQVMVGDNYFGCMTGLSIGTWIQNAQTVELLSDRPFPLYDGKMLFCYNPRKLLTKSVRKLYCRFCPWFLLVYHPKNHHHQNFNICHILKFFNSSKFVGSDC